MHNNIIKRKYFKKNKNSLGKGINSSKLNYDYDNESISDNPITSPLPNHNKNIMRLVYPEKNFYIPNKEDEDDFLNSLIFLGENEKETPIKYIDSLSSLGSKSSIDKPDGLLEFIIQRPKNKFKEEYDIERPNPFWNNGNEDYGQYIELTNSSNEAKGIQKRRSLKKRSSLKNRRSLKKRRSLKNRRSLKKRK